MGATNIAIRVKGSEAVMRKAYKRKVDEDARYYGSNSYNGSFSTFGGQLQVRSYVFNSVEEANDYIDNHHSKWDGAVAVQFKIYKPNKSMENLLRQIYELRTERVNAKTERRIKTLDKRIAEKQAKLKEWRSKLGTKAKRTEWLVGGWAAT